MVEKLKSTLKQVHWSLALKAGIFALSWLLLPFWLFFVIALCLYFIPWFQAGKLAPPFTVLLVLAFLETPEPWFALIIGVIFYYLLYIKDLLAIDRRSAYELLVVALSFFLVREFYLKFQNGFGGFALWYALFIAVIVGWLIHSYIKSFAPETGPENAERAMSHPAGWLSAVLMWQFLILGLILPLDFIYQSIVVFLAAVLIIDLIPEYCLDGFIPRQKLLIASTTIAALMIIMLGSARWIL